MPADHALGSDHDQVSAPVTMESADHNPEELVAGAEPRSSPSRPRQYRELMTQQDIFGHPRLAVAHGTRASPEYHAAQRAQSSGRLFAPRQPRVNTVIPGF